MTLKARALALVTGLLVRLLTLPLAGSTYLHDLFLPFVDAFVRQPTANPWLAYDSRHFPYGSVLLVILSLPKWLAFQLLGESAMGQQALSFALLKLPLLAVDLAFVWLLCKFSQRHEQRILYFFWLNPVLIYITYVYGQLDLVSMFFCLLSLHFLVRSSPVKSSLALALAALCKTHVALLIPYMLAYLWNKHFSRQALLHIGLWLVLFGSLTALGFVPLYVAGVFLKASASNPEAGRLLAARIDFGGGLTLYLGLSFVLAVLARLCLSSTISAEGLVYGSGLVFGSVLLVTNAAPGWYSWYIPFLALFWANYTTAPFSVFAALHLTFLAYYGFFPGNSLAFTLLQTALASTLLVMWVVCVSTEVPVTGRIRPYLIGIAGDSGAGKNTLTQSFGNLFSPELTVVLEGDDYHRWERTHDSWQQFTHLDPRANYLASMVEHVLQLTRGKTVFCPHYDHHTGTFTEPREIRPNRTVIVQGLHTFYVRRLRDCFDLKIFLNTDGRVAQAWKLARDVKERNRDAASVLRSMASRLADSQLHILPQSEYADWIICVRPRADAPEDLDPGSLPLEIHYSFWNDAPVERLVQTINQSRSCRVSQRPGAHLERVEYVVENVLSAEECERIAVETFPAMRQLIRARRFPQFDSGILGIHQLFLVALMQS